MVLILDKRGSGKSALAYRLLELFRYHKLPYVVAVPIQLTDVQLKIVEETLRQVVASGGREQSRSRQPYGKHLGAIPFGYQSCWKEGNGERVLICKPEHPGGVHVHLQEGEAVTEMFQQYATGTTTLSALASWMNGQGFMTRNRHKKRDLPLASRASGI